MHIFWTDYFQPTTIKYTMHFGRCYKSGFQDKLVQSAGSLKGFFRHSDVWEYFRIPAPTVKTFTNKVAIDTTMF